MNPASPKTAALNFLRKHLFQYPPVEAALSRVVKGRPPGHWLSRLVPNHVQYLPNSIRFVERENLRLELDLSDLMEWSLYYDFADTSAENLLKLCQIGDTVVDVGANVGAMTFKAANRVGIAGRVFAFEPDPGRFAKCEKNLLQSHLPNVELFSLGLSDRMGAARIRTRNIHNQGMNQIAADHQIEGAMVALTTLDRFFLERTPARFDVMKIDVEGHEFKVLRGAAETLKRFRPRLFVEVDDANLRSQGSTPEELISYLRGFGYQISANQAGEALPPLEKCHFDLVGLP